MASDTVCHRRSQALSMDERFEYQTRSIEERLNRVEAQSSR